MKNKTSIIIASSVLAIAGLAIVIYFIARHTVAGHFTSSLRIADGSHALASALVPGETYAGGRIRFVMARGNLDQVERLIEAEMASYKSVTSFPASLATSGDLRRCIDALHTTMDLQLTILKGLHEDRTSAVRSVEQYADADRHTYKLLESCANTAKRE